MPTEPSKKRFEKMFHYNGTPLENVQELRCLSITLSHKERMTNVSKQMARNFAGAIARVWRICSGLGIKNRKRAMLWTFQVFAFLQVYWVSSLG